MSNYSPTQQQQNYSQSTAFAEALQRAKQIAAKIQPGNQPQGGQKRPSDESFDSNKKRFSGGENYNANSPPLSNATAAAQQQAQALAARLGNKNNSNNSQNSGPSPPQEAVQRARELINKMVGQGGPGMGNNHGGNGGGNGGGPPNNRPGLGSNNYHNPNQHVQELMVAGPKVGLLIGKGGETIKQLQERSGVKMVIIQEGPGLESEKPLRITGDYEKVEMAKQMVLDFLTELDAKQGQRGGNGERNDYEDRGQGGDFRGNHGGGFNRGGGQGGFNNGGGHGGGGRGNPMHHQQNGPESFEMIVPKAAVGCVIGKGGDMIKRIAKESGAKLQFIEGSEPNGDRRCVLQGIRPCVESGKRMIEELIDGALKRHGLKTDEVNYANYQGPMVTREEYTFTIPASKCGIVIGRGGDTIKQINQQSGAHCEMDRKASANQTLEKTFTIKGEQHQIDEAKRLIQDKINIEISMNHVGSSQVPATQSSFSNAANPYAQWMGGWDPSQAAAAAATQQAQPQADYSMQWIEYYKQMGMHREAEMIEQQLKMRGGTGQPAAAPASAPANGQQQAVAQAGAGAPVADYSAQWAEYYRRMGKVEEAEAIEKHMQISKSGQGAQPPQPAAAGGAPNPAAAGAAPNPYAANQMAAYQQQYQQQYYGAQAGYPGYPAYAGYPGAPGAPQPAPPAQAPAPNAPDGK